MADGATDIMIVHNAKNISHERTTCGLCPITLLKGGGIAVVPQCPEGSPHRPNRSLAFWPGTDLRDGRISAGNRYWTVRHETGNETPLRFGFNDTPGWAAYSVGEAAFVKHFVHNQQAAYPDFGSSCEVRLTADFTEIDSLSPLFRIEPGEGIKHVENLSLIHLEKAPDFSSEEGLDAFAELLQ